MHPPRKYILVSSLISLGMALIVAAGMMYIAWDHNPQQEFHGDGFINWSNWLWVGGSWFVVSLLVFLVGGMVLFLAKITQNK